MRNSMKKTYKTPTHPLRSDPYCHVDHLGNGRCVIRHDGRVYSSWLSQARAEERPKAEKRTMLKALRDANQPEPEAQR
jgi:hypothetical protein